MIRADVTYTIEHFKEIPFIYVPFNQRMMWLAITAVSTAVAMFTILMGENFFNLFTGLAIVSWCVTLFYIIFNYVLFNPQKMFKKYSEAQPDSHIILEFGDISLKTTIESQTTNGVNESLYDVFESSWENDKFFVIRVKNSGAYVIKKSEITDGTPEELRQLLTDKLGSKFEIRK